VIAVRLTEIKVEVRVSAAQKVARKEPTERIALLMAALQPSNRTYYLSDRERPLIKRYAA